MIYRYPQEVHDFVKAHCREMRDGPLAEACNAALGTEFTKEKMRAFRANHKYKNGMPKGLRSHEIWPEGMIDYIRTHSHGVPSKEMAERVNALFGTHFTPTGMKQFRTAHGIRSGVTGWFQKGRSPGNKGKRQEEYMSPEAIERCSATRFKKGNVPANELPVGSIVKNTDGYMLRKKSAEGSQWERREFLHRAVWEEHHGPIPEGMVVTFKDSNPENCNIENLILITRGEAAALTRKGYRSEDPDLTVAALNMIRVRQKANRIRKERRQA